jgi:hypothetical protein
MVRIMLVAFLALVVAAEGLLVRKPPGGKAEGDTIRDTTDHLAVVWGRLRNQTTEAAGAGWGLLLGLWRLCKDNVGVALDCVAYAALGYVIAAAAWRCLRKRPSAPPSKRTLPPGPAFPVAPLLAVPVGPAPPIWGNKNKPVV